MQEKKVVVTAQVETPKVEGPAMVGIASPELVQNLKAKKKTIGKKELVKRATKETEVKTKKVAKAKKGVKKGAPKKATEAKKVAKVAKKNKKEVTVKKTTKKATAKAKVLRGQRGTGIARRQILNAVMQGTKNFTLKDLQTFSKTISKAMRAYR